MSSQSHDLFIDTDRSKAVLSASDSSIAVLPAFIQGDGLNLRIMFLKGYTRTAAYARIPVAGITAEVALGTKIGNTTLYYTQQFTWDPSIDLAQPFFSAQLPMNTGAINTLLGSNAVAQAYFEVKLVEDGMPRTVLSELVNIFAAVIKNGGLTEPVSPTPLTVEVANATYLRREIHGVVRWINDATGKAVDQYVGDDGEMHFDQVT